MVSIRAARIFVGSIIDVLFAYLAKLSWSDLRSYMSPAPIFVFTDIMCNLVRSMMLCLI